jgi:hypothetical protein
MGRGQGIDNLKAAETPRSVLRVEHHCQACGSQSTFDGHGGEWCPKCRTDRHLQPEERLYQLVEIDLDF